MRRSGSLRLLLSAALVVSGLSSLTTSGATVPVGRTTLLSASILTGKASSTGSVMSTAISSDGQFVVFASSAADLVVGDTNADSDIFEYNRGTRLLTRVSVASDGTQGVGTSRNVDPNAPLPLGSVGPAISAKGRFVAFTSDAVNLVTGDTNLVPDVFVHDLVTKKTARVSVATGGGEANDSSGQQIAISGDGRYVAFVSDASNLVPGDTNGKTDLFVHDRSTNRTTRITGAAGVGSGSIAMSQDGRYVAYPAVASTAAGTTGGPGQEVLIRDLRTGADKRGDVLDGGRAPLHTSAFSGAWLTQNSLSATGRYLLFSSTDSYVPNKSTMSTIPGTPGYEVYRHDFVTGRTQRLTVTSAGAERDGGVVADGSLSPDGRFAVFSTAQQFDASTRAPCVLCSTRTVYTHDCDTGTTTAQSWTYDDEIAGVAPGEVDNGPSVIGAWPDISSGGRYVSFASNAANAVPGNPGLLGQWNAYLRDRGLPRGVGEIAVANAAGFARTGILDTPDSTTDVSPVLTDRGANLDEAALIYRPASQDLYVRLQLMQMPMFGLADPSIVYAMDMRVGGTTYELRAQKVGPVARFGLFRATTYGWAYVGDVNGGYGTTGDEVVAAVPLQLVAGSHERVVLSNLHVMTGLGTFSTGIRRTLDSLSLQGV